MPNIPNDPFMLLSFLNTKLRDEYDNLNLLCKALNLNYDELIDKLSAIGYSYSPELNRFL